MTELSRVVVGVDDSEGARRALRFAIEEAVLRRAALDVVHAYREHQFVALRVPADPGAASRAALDARELLDGILTEVVTEVGQPSLDITQVVVDGDEGESLVDAARGASLLVVGRGDHGMLAGTILGSTSRHCVDHGHCPVVVVPPT
jgi:nucleotide-binding universal stress UspA family protein